MDTIKKSWRIISNKSRSRLKIYLVLVFVVSILEVTGISLILPIISAINNDLINTNLYFLKSLSEYFKIETQLELVTLLLCIFLLFIIFKNIIISFYLL